MGENNCKKQEKKIIVLGDFYQEHGIYEKLRKYYEEKIKIEYKIDNFVSELKKNGCVKEDNDSDLEEGKEIKCLYIGTIINMSPSGKYYLPFAHSNVSEKEAIRDEIFWCAFEELLNEKGLWTENGEGDALDIFICGVFDKEVPESEED